MTALTISPWRSRSTKKLYPVTVNSTYSPVSLTRCSGSRRVSAGCRARGAQAARVLLTVWWQAMSHCLLKMARRSSS